MARLNISIPDALYERLDRLRDRVNASKVCAAALEKELTMIESPTVAMDSTEAKAALLVGRLRGHREEWYQRGREAGEGWALEVASLEELKEVERGWSGIEDFDLMTSGAERLGSFADKLPYTFTERDDAVWNEPLAIDAAIRGAYLLGWHKAVTELWAAARPQLMERDD